MASRERSDPNVTCADSHREAWTGREPYGVFGESSARRDVRRLKCFDSSSATFVQSEKKA